MKKRMKPIAVFLLIFCIGYAIGSQHIKRWYWEYTLNKERAKKFLNKMSPEIVTTTIDEKIWKLRDHRGKVVLIDFWSTWCPPCVRSIPDMKEIFEQYGYRDDFLMIGVSLDNSKRDLEKFIKDHEIHWLQLFEKNTKKDGKNGFARKYEVKGIPSIWIIDKQGFIKAIDLDGKKEIERKLKKLL